MAERTHLFLALSSAGWGEAAFGLHLAEQLRQRGERVVFLHHPNVGGLLAETPFQHLPFSDELGSVAWSLIEESARQLEVASIVLCDNITTDTFFIRRNVDGCALLELGVPVIAVDTWDYAKRKDMIDIGGGNRLAHEWVSLLPSILPCPIVRPNERPGVCDFAPPPVVTPSSARTEVRAALGLSGDDVAVLFCTALWQQMPYSDLDVIRCRDHIPLLLANYALHWDRRVHLVHVGPKPIEALRLNGCRYKWLPPLGAKFDRVLGAADLLLSANVSATTVSKAIASQVPVLVLENSCQAATVDDATAWLGRRATPDVIDWLQEAVPLFPFRLWPLGFHRFLEPVLSDNPYMHAIERAEWLDRHDVFEKLHSLLFSASARARLQQRQFDYMMLLDTLPSAADVFGSLVEHRQQTARS